MGVFGELFGKKLTDESGADSDGQSHRPRVDIDLDAGVIRVSPREAAPPTEETGE